MQVLYYTLLVCAQFQTLTRTHARNEDVNSPSLSAASPTSSSPTRRQNLSIFVRNHENLNEPHSLVALIEREALREELNTLIVEQRLDVSL